MEGPIEVGMPVCFTVQSSSAWFGGKLGSSSDYRLIQHCIPGL